MLAGLLGRDGQALSASQTWWQALADADHLAVLHAIWTAETAPARDQRYRGLLAAALPPGSEQEEPSYREKWLWKTLHAAELHAVAGALPWAVSALGAVPDYPTGRLEWQRKDTSVGASRELWLILTLLLARIPSTDVARLQESS